MRAQVSQRVHEHEVTKAKNAEPQDSSFKHRDAYGQERGGLLQSGDKLGAAGAGGDVRPGDRYRIYDERDVAGTVAEPLLGITERVAGWCGVGVGVVEKVVGNFERRMRRWWKVEARRRRGEEEEQE